MGFMTNILHENLPILPLLKRGSHSADRLCCRPSSLRVPCANLAQNYVSPGTNQRYSVGYYLTSWATTVVTSLQATMTDSITYVH